jgi:hypothetical protein
MLRCVSITPIETVVTVSRPRLRQHRLGATLPVVGLIQRSFAAHCSLLQFLGRAPVKIGLMPEAGGPSSRPNHALMCVVTARDATVWICRLQDLIPAKRLIRS